MPRIDSLVAAVFDTHAWVWTVAGEPQAQRLSAFRGRVVVSSISVWEVAMLEAKGRLQLKHGVEVWLDLNLAAPVALEPLGPVIAVESCRLPGFHGDPADRIIVATACVLGLPLITADSEIHDWNRRHQQLQLLSP